MRGALSARGAAFILNHLFQFQTLAPNGRGSGQNRQKLSSSLLSAIRLISLAELVDTGYQANYALVDICHLTIAHRGGLRALPFSAGTSITAPSGPKIAHTHPLGLPAPKTASTLVACRGRKKMYRNTLNVLLNENSPDYTGLVQQWLSGAGEAVTFDWSDSLTAGLHRLAQGPVEVVPLDLGLPDGDRAETSLATRAHAYFIPTIVLSAANSESLALQMIQQEAEDYLVKSTCTAELLVRTLRYAVICNQVSAGAASETGRVIGAKGGADTTSVACNLAAIPCHQTGSEVLLADLDLNSGLDSFLLGLHPRCLVVDAINNVDRLDRDCWDSIAAHGTTGLQVIASSRMLRNSELPAEGLRRAFDLIRPFYRWMVIDFGALSGVSRSLLDGIDERSLVLSRQSSANRAILTTGYHASSYALAKPLHLIAYDSGGSIPEFGSKGMMVSPRNSRLQGMQSARLAPHFVLREFVDVAGETYGS
jgi:CheY-like chemotaxis protein